LSRKGVRNGAEKSGRPFVDDEEVEMEVRKWRREVKTLYSACVIALIKRWDKCISVGGGYVEK
jgi:hypothetical protein